MSNPTLLNNGDFRKPINQRGQKEYNIASDAIYSVDRWKIGPDCKLTIEDGYVKLQKTNMGDWNCCLTEKIKLSKSVAATSSIFYRTTGDFYFWNGSHLPKSSDWTVFSVSAAIQPSADGIFDFMIYGPHSVVQEIDIRAVKLELGPVQTLAHKEGGTWVLNDPPPDPTLELAKCQSYQEKVTSMRTGNSTLGGYVAVGGEYNRLLFAEPIPFKIRKRVMPIIKDVILVPILDDGTATTEMRPTIDWSYCTEDALFQCAVSSQYAIESGRKYYISFLADANL